MELAINKYTDEIINAVKNNQVTVITSGTGTGKSTQVPQMLHSEGYNIAITQPRIVAAKMLAMRISNEMECELGGIIGYSTGLDKNFSKDTEILITTDGVQVLKEINSTKHEKERILIIDEVHEWNLSIETLIAYCKVILKKNKNFKVVLMSATLDTSQLEKFFDIPIKLIDIKEKSYEVARLNSSGDLYSDIRSRMAYSENILVFLPGKKEIYDMFQKLEDINSNYIILPMHSELPYEKIQECLLPSDKKKIILATNIAQTSLTNPDIDTVIDSGLERRMETIDGITGLYLRNISIADTLQRLGRVGRTKPGNYILCEETFVSKRTEYPIPEIRRLGLERVCLTLIKLGFNPSKFDFFHQPNYSSIIRAITMLIDLGCIVDEDNPTLTLIGEKILSLPLSIRMGRILVEAIDLKNSENALIAIAVHEVGNIITDKSFFWIPENTCDMIRGYQYWMKIMALGKIDFNTMGINKRAFFKVKEIINKIRPILLKNNEWSNNGSLSLLLNAIVSGYCDSPLLDLGVSMDKHSCVYPKSNKILLGEMKTIEVKSKYLYESHNVEILTNITSVDPMFLVDKYPSLYDAEELREVFDYWSEEIYSEKRLNFKGSSVKVFDVPVNNPKRLKELIEEEENKRRAARDAEIERQRQRDLIMEEERQRLMWSMRTMREEEERNKFTFGTNGSVNKQSIRKTLPTIYLAGSRVEIDEDYVVQISKTQLKQLYQPVTYNGGILTLDCQGIKSSNPKEIKDKLKETSLMNLVNHINSIKNISLEMWVTKLKEVIELYSDYIHENDIKNIALTISDKRIHTFQVDSESNFDQILNEASIKYYLCKIQYEYPPAKFKHAESTSMFLTDEEKNNREFFFEMMKDEIMCKTELSDRFVLSKAKTIYGELVS